MEEKTGDLSNTFWYVIIGICLALIVFIAIGFAVFANRDDKVVNKTENGGYVVLNYTNNVSGLSIRDVTPITDAIGMANSNDGEYFDFSVEVTLDNAKSVEYEISALKDPANSNISDDDIRIYLEKEESGEYVAVFDPKGFTPIEKDSKLGSTEGSMILNSVKKTKSTTDNYRLRIWLADTSLLKKGNYSVEIVVNGKAK